MLGVGLGLWASNLPGATPMPFAFVTVIVVLIVVGLLGAFLPALVARRAAPGRSPIADAVHARCREILAGGGGESEAHPD